MALTLVLHEATRTGAPRVGGLIAGELAKVEDLKVIVMKDGPLVPWLADLVGAERLIVCQPEEFSHHVPFEKRLDRASALLAEWPTDLVYVNSLAASIFVLAANSLNRRTVIHVHEKAAEIYKLFRHNVAKIEAMTVADGVVLAAEELAFDILEVFGRIPARLLAFGIAIEIEAVKIASAKKVRPAKNALNRALRPGERPLIGMCGHASPRKGSDIFFATAAAMPDHDFLWIGGWDPDEAIENTAYDSFLTKKLPNLYVTGVVDNPYGYIGKLDIFFLSSREDPNPLVLAEAVALQIPILCFSKTTAVSDRLGRTAIFCYGTPNVLDAVRILKACTPAAIRTEAFRGLADASIGAFDLDTKMKDVMELILMIRADKTDSAADERAEVLA